MRYRRGWFNDSHRHYLASKGISTNRYFVRHELKGNRGGSLLHSLYARGYSNPEIAQDPTLPVPLRNEAISKLRGRHKVLIDVPERAGGDAPSTMESTVPTLAESASFSSLPSSQVPVVEQSMPAPVESFAPSTNFSQIDSSSVQEGIAPVESEGFEEPQPLPSSQLSDEVFTSSQDENDERTSTVVTPGVPEVPNFGMVGQ